ncbi:MAG: hypothetical protein PHQ60_04920 [Sideroxydans sp.]|nr:hypothetical protein [Sideroxydans sp.]
MNKISEQEFIHRVANIPLTVLRNTSLRNIFTPFSRRCQEQEFEFTIDHKLGTDFPADKRQRMREIFCPFNINKNSLLKKYKQGAVSGEQFAQQMQLLLDDLIAKYSQVLSADELNSFLGVAPNSHASFPFDPHQSD